MKVQGDIFFVRTKAAAIDTKQLKKTTDFIIAEGELTGHAHRVSGDALIYEKDGTLYIKVEKNTLITHEEHRPIILDEGVWEVGRVMEHDYFDDFSRKVID